jgi:mannose-6-phosphate isomerase
MSAERQNATSEMAPFRIDPKFDTRVWGSRDLRPWFDRVAESGDPIGEVWLTGDMCLVATGPHKGKRLDALFAEAKCFSPNKS